jgi:hypothetical protein
MNTLLRRLAMSATTVAVTAGTVSLTAGSAHAAPNDELPDSLRNKAFAACATPFTDATGEHEGRPIAFDPHTYKEVTSETGELVARWTVGTAKHVSDSSKDIECLVAEVDEPAAIKGKTSSKASVTLIGSEAFKVKVLDGMGKTFAYEAGPFVQHQLDAKFAAPVHYGDPATAPAPTGGNVATFGAQFEAGQAPEALNLYFDAEGLQTVGSFEDVTSKVSVEQPAAVKAAATALKAKKDKAAKAQYATKATTISKDKSKARAKVMKSTKLTKKAKLAQLRKIDKSASAKRADARDFRDAKLAKYKKELAAKLAPTTKDVVEAKTVVKEVQWAATVSDKYVAPVTEPAPTDPTTPTDPAPTDPTDPAPTDPTDPAPTDPAPTDPAPTDPAPETPADPGTGNAQQ